MNALCFVDKHLGMILRTIMGSMIGCEWARDRESGHDWAMQAAFKGLNRLWQLHTGGGIQVA